MPAFCKLTITLVRISTAAWVGAAALFVFTSIHEQRCPVFDSATKDVLATIRFPDYYRFGFVLAGIATVASIGHVMANPGRHRRMLVTTILLVLSLAIMLIDYFGVYLPLQNLIDPPGQVRNQHFLWYHSASRYINELHVGLCAVAMLIINAPLDGETAAHNRETAVVDQTARPSMRSSESDV